MRISGELESVGVSFATGALTVDKFAGGMIRYRDDEAMISITLLRAASARHSEHE